MRTDKDLWKCVEAAARKILEACEVALSAPMSANDELLLTADVAKRLGVTAQMVRLLDRDLRPSRSPGGKRVYDARRVEQVAAKRAMRKKRD